MLQIPKPSSVDVTSKIDLWRSLAFYGFYRLFLGVLLILLAFVFESVLSLSMFEQTWVLRITFAYVFLSAVSLLGIYLRRPGFTAQLAFQVGTDILVISVLSYFTGGIQNNLSMLLLVTLASAGMISRGRITLFYAALASIAILLEHSYSVLTQDASAAQFLQAGILSASYFAVAWLSHALSKYAVASENLAFSRGIDLSSMAEANRLMIQDMPDGMLVVDARGRVRQSNPSAERLLGFSLDKDSASLLEQCSPLLHAMFAAWRQNSALGNEVLRLPDTNRWVRVRFLPIRQDQLWGAVIVLEDMQRAQEQAQQVKLAALGRLTANIAHEVRNPLSSISYATELLRERTMDRTEQRLSQIILDNTARLNRIVQDVMQLNRRDRVKPEPVDLAQRLPSLVAELVETHQLPADRITVATPEHCEVEFDRGHFEQVIWNLCQNALRYCQKLPASVKLMVAAAGDGKPYLDIEDDGPGISAETTPKLFEPFFTTEAGGTGLGLYIARELCEANGATLEYRATAQTGACFRIVFGQQKS